MKTMDLVLSLRDELEITEHISKLLFGTMDERANSLTILNFYSLVKKVVISSGG